MAGCVALLGWSLQAPAGAQEAEPGTIPVVIERADTGDVPRIGLLWATEPGETYTVLQSPDLNDWSVVPGFPRLSGDPVDFFSRNIVAEKAFFRVEKIDTSGPVIASRYPRDKDFAVRRDSPVVVDLSDQTGIDWSSVVFTEKDGNRITTADAALSIEGDRLTYTPASGLLGDHGESVTVSLEVADTLGNASSFTWSFELALLPRPAENLFVFGSVAAGAKGQSLPWKRGPGGDGDSWEIDQVLPDRILIVHTGSAPVFPAGQPLANAAPRSPDEIFYRRVLSTSNDPDSGVLTILTEEVVLGQILEEGSFAVTGDVEEIGFPPVATGGQMRVENFGLPFGYSTALPGMGGRFDGQTVFSEGPVSVGLDQAWWNLDARLFLAGKIRGLVLEELDVRLDASAAGIIEPVVALGLGASKHGSVRLHTMPTRVFRVMVGYVPVFINVEFNIDAVGEVSFDATAEFQWGTATSLRLAPAFHYENYGGNPMARFDPGPAAVPTGRHWGPELSVSGSISATGRLEPRLRVLLYGAAGVGGAIVPGIYATGSAEGTTRDIGNLTASVVMTARVDFEASLEGPMIDTLVPDLEPWSVPLYSRSWKFEHPPPDGIYFEKQPEDVAINEDGHFWLEALAVAEKELSYQWFHERVPIPGETGPRLARARASLGHSGEYFVRASAGGKTADSNPAILNVIPKGDRYAALQAAYNESFRINYTDGSHDLIEMNIDANLEVAPVNPYYASGWIRASRAHVNGTIRAHGRARAHTSGGALYNDLHFDHTARFDDEFDGWVALDPFNKTVGHVDLVFATGVPSDRERIYGAYYNPASGRFTTWVSLRQPFQYPVDLEYYDGQASALLLRR